MLSFATVGSLFFVVISLLFLFFFFSSSCARPFRCTSSVKHHRTYCENTFSSVVLSGTSPPTQNPSGEQKSCLQQLHVGLLCHTMCWSGPEGFAGSSVFCASSSVTVFTHCCDLHSMSACHCRLLLAARLCDCDLFVINRSCWMLTAF